jgi:FKBP-type peptidyl-prolyl cis-trans isomerase 2
MVKLMTVKKGDIVRIDYEAFVAEDNRLFDTTKESAAQEAGIFDEKYRYAAMPVLIGGGKVFPGLEEAIMAAAVGEETEVTVPYAEAAGERDPKKVETYPMRDFIKQEIQPYPGLELTLGNRRATILTVSSGRVRVDFNNPLAGKDLVYKFTVNEVIEDPVQKAMALIDLDFGNSDGFTAELQDDKVVITLSEVTKFDQSWPMARFRLVSDLREALSVDTVEFVEVWSKVKADEPAAEESSE